MTCLSREWVICKLVSAPSSNWVSNSCSGSLPLTQFKIPTFTRYLSKDGSLNMCVYHCFFHHWFLFYILRHQPIKTKGIEMNDIVETVRQMHPRKLYWSFCNASERLRTRVRYKQIWRWMWGCKYRSGCKSKKKVNHIHSPTLAEDCCFHYGGNEPKWLIKWKWGSCLTFTVMSCYHMHFQTVDGWLKVMILYHFRKITSVLFDYQRHLQK